MRPIAGLLVAALLAQGLALARPAALDRQEPVSSPIQSNRPEPVPSAAQPAAAGQGDERYARKGLELVRAHLAGLDDLPQGEVTISAGAITGRCIAAEGASTGLLVCQYGPAPDRPVAHGLFWLDDGVWQGQLYPQALGRLAAERRQHFHALGCPTGCTGNLRQVRQGWGESGMELLIVLDLGTQSAPMEEVHLLRLVDETWEVAWAPAPGNWNWGHGHVTLGQTGLNGFAMRSSSWGRQDRLAGYLAEPADGEHRQFHERWVRKGSGYLLRDQVEEPAPYGALVRLIFYLSHHDDTRAQRLLGESVDLDEARKALAQQPPRQGWRVERVDRATFRLDRDGDGKADLIVGFAEQGAGWVLTRLGRP